MIQLLCKITRLAYLKKNFHIHDSLRIIIFWSFDPDFCPIRNRTTKIILPVLFHREPLLCIVAMATNLMELQNGNAR